jgi:hypothetical protein
MVDEVMWERKNGQDVWQNARYAEPVPIRAYCDDETHVVEDQNGVKQTAAGTVYTADVYGIQPGDRLTRDGRELGDIIRVKNYRDEEGPYGSEIHHG